MSNRIAFVTGANGAIGGATAEKLCNDGFTVIAADVNVDENSPDARAGRALRLDVSKREEVVKAVEAIVRTHKRIDVLVNVAGVSSTGSSSLIDEDEWDRVLDINLAGTFWCCQAVLPVMKANRWGRIINLGSVLGKNGGNARPWLSSEEQATSGNVAYGISKAGVHAMTAYLAKEMASFGVTVNAVAPGPIASGMTQSLSATITDMIPVGRMGTPKDVADLVAYLASEQSSFLSGEVVNLNGAMWCG